ncbi:MAG: AraC family transcriptional regulator ligand-binding domain-containing protein, partial [Myxococcota bacterium]
MAAVSLEEGQIAAANVRPAFEVALARGVSEDELRQIGLTRAALADPASAIPGEATYAQMDLMHRKPGFGDFLLQAARPHGLSSLGVVGLACKSVATVAEAMLCHQRFQHLTNRTARYESTAEAGRLVIREERFGPARLGSLLVSDYTMLIAVHLLRDNVRGDVPVVRVTSRRATIDDDERAQIESFMDAPLRLGGERAQLELDASLLARAVATADTEMAEYFQALLARAARFAPTEDPLLIQIRLSVRDALVHGAPTAADVAKRLGLGQRTLQRRLATMSLTFSDVLETTRKGLAEGYLEDATLSLAEIAYLLGYREQSSFFRAFKRWH